MDNTDSNNINTFSKTHEMQCDKFTPLVIGTVIAERYKIIGNIGQGGMGIVYKAEDTHIPWSPLCAIKETPFPTTRSASFPAKKHAEYLLHEAEIISKLDHPNIPRIIDYISTNSRFYLVREFVDGDTLAKLLENQMKVHKQGFDPGKVIPWILNIVDIFTYLHGPNVELIYRDCKPSNFILTNKNDIKIIDFGIARKGPGVDATKVGTAGYTAPEVYSNGPFNHLVDIYSIGVLTHVLLTGFNPDEGILDWNNRQPRSFRNDITPEFNEIIMKCLCSQPDQRWRSAEELRDALYSLLIHQSGEDTNKVVPKWLKSSTTSTENPGIGSISPKLLWCFETQRDIHSTPTIGRDGIYCSSNDEHLYKLDFEGKTINSFNAGDFLFSDPILTERNIIITTQDGHVIALDHALKRKEWSYAIGKPVVSSPSRLKDIFAIGSSDGYAYGFSINGSRPLWKVETFNAIRGVFSTIHDMIVFGSDDARIYAIDNTGNIVWHRTTRDVVIAAPVYTNSIIVVGGIDRTIYAIEPTHGILLWRKTLDSSIMNAVAGYQNKIYAGTTEGTIYCLNATTQGEICGQIHMKSQITTDLVIRKDRLYFGCANGSMYCYDLKTHTPIWRYMTYGAVVTRPVFHNNSVIIASHDHMIYAVADTLEE